MTYITGLGGTPGPGWFTDDNGQPKLWVATETWALPNRAGEWTSGNWQGDYDNFFATRSAQGFTVTMTDPVAGTSSGAPNDNGNTWDGVTPLAGGSTDPSSAALNNTFWDRIDYVFSTAASNGMTIGLRRRRTGTTPAAVTCTTRGPTTQWTDCGALIGARYKNTPNLVWLVGNDAFSPFSDTQWNALLAGLRGAGDTHLIAPWYNAECTSRYLTDTNASEDWGVSNADVQFLLHLQRRVLGHRVRLR